MDGLGTGRKKESRKYEEYNKSKYLIKKNMRRIP